MRAAEIDVEADNTVTAGQHDQECAGSLNSEEEHSLGPAGNRDITDDRPTWRGLPESNSQW
jgi:hypothetical protein